jgi:dihydrodipicolinate synthase/N-acetylneuraminate lyase
MTPDPPFRGVGVALVTLFSESGDLDEAATADHAARMVELGMQAVVVAGTTGEAAALSPEERNRLTERVRAAVPAGSGALVIAGTGAPSAHQAVAYTEAAVDRGVDAVLVLSPPATADPRPYYDTVAKAAAGVPVLAYHWPAASAPGIPVAMLADLPVAGCKDSSGDADRLLETLATWPGHLYVGSSAILSFAGPLGCAGAILSLANAEPEPCTAAWTGDAAAQRDLAEAHGFMRSAFPGAVKELTARRFGTPGTVRMGQ